MIKPEITNPGKPNLVSVRGGYFPLPLKIIGPTTWHDLRSANYGSNPVGGSKLIESTFGQVVELAGLALTDYDKHRADKRFNPAFNPVLHSINGPGKVLMGNSFWIVSPKKTYFIDNPSQEIIAQFGVNNQNVLERLISEFNKKLERRMERGGITYGDNIASVSTADVFQGHQSRDNAESHFGRNLALIASVRSNEVAKSLEVGSQAYAHEAYFSLNGKSNEIVTRAPMLSSYGFASRLLIDGSGHDAYANGCSFGMSPVKMGN
jgi:hypothetical protein